MCAAIWDALLTQHGHDRLGGMPPLRPHVVDETHDQWLRGGRAPPAKKIEAAFKISLASRIRLFLALSRLISADSSVVPPRDGIPRRPGTGSPSNARTRP